MLHILTYICNYSIQCLNELFRSDHRLENLGKKKTVATVAVFFYLPLAPTIDPYQQG